MQDDETRKTVWSLIDSIGFCMLVTHDEGDRLRARPMSARLTPGDERLFLLTDVANRKDDEISKDPQVCLAFADSGGHRYLSLSGHAVVSNDRAKIAELWSVADKAWWDDKDDPDIRLLVVTPTQAEYWDGPGAIVATVKMTVAALTGQRPQLGENKKVPMLEH